MRLLGGKLKRKLVTCFVAWTDGWNREFHEAIEQRVMDEYKRIFPESHSTPDEIARTIERMRTFYYQRMVATSTLLLAVASFIVAVLALFVAIVI